MICPICHDEAFLSLPSEPACKEDLPIAQDLLDTLQAHRDACVGMAANMIGQRKNIIVVATQTEAGEPVVMINPRILERRGLYTTQEGCLSLEGLREARRYRVIRVQYEDRQGVRHEEEYRDFTAQIIQHEMDHCRGILI